MGYDMRLVRDDDSMQTENAKATEDFNRAVTERDALDRNSPEHAAAQKRVEQAFGRMNSTDLNYFRLNIWGMSKAREHMMTLGMLAVHYDGYPPFPSFGDFGLTEEEWYDEDDPPGS